MLEMQSKGTRPIQLSKNKANKEKGMVASKEDKKEGENEMSFIAFEKATRNSNLWIGNTGASTHMKNTLEGLYDLREEETTIQIGNGKNLKSTTTGTLKATVQQLDGTAVDVKLENVAYVPELSINLFSITKAIGKGFQVSNKGNIMRLTKGLMTIKFDKLQKTKNGFCPGILMKTKIPQESAHTAQMMTSAEAHQKLGNSGKKSHKIATKGSRQMDSLKLKECEVCYMGIMNQMRDGVEERKATIKLMKLDKRKVEKNKDLIREIKEEKIEIEKEEFKLKKKFKIKEKIETDEAKFKIEETQIKIEENIEISKKKIVEFMIPMMTTTMMMMMMMMMMMKY